MFHPRSRLGALRFGGLGFCAILLMPFLDAAHVSAQDAPRLSTDRPGNGNAASSVPRYHLNIESAFAWTGDNGSDSYSLPVLLRYGLFSFLELRAAPTLPGVFVPDGGDASLEGTDTVVGTKVWFYTSDTGRFDFAASVDVALPSGSDRFTAGAAAPDARLLMASLLPWDLSLLLNAGVLAPERPRGRNLQLLSIINLSRSLPGLEQLSLFVEHNHVFDTRSADSATWLLNWGAAWLLAPRWQLDFYLQHGLNEQSADLQLQFGLSTIL